MARLMSTPILNPPQSAILGMHKIQERPMAVGGQDRGSADDVPRRCRTTTASSTASEAVSFLVRVKEGIEDPRRLLLESIGAITDHE